MYATPVSDNARLILVALAVGAVLALAGCGAAPNATSRQGSAGSCAETAQRGEYACVDGRLPRDHVARGCGVYASMYSIDLWRCDAEQR